MSGYGAYFESFTVDRRTFFESVKTFEDAENRAYDEDHHYEFIATNEKLIRQTFNSLLKRLREDKVNQDIFWFYCYYCSIMLQRYHLDYDQKAKANEFLRLRKQIKARCVYGADPKKPANNDSFATHIAKKLADSLVDLSTTLVHPSKVRDKMAYANVIRIYWFFCRTTVSKSLILASDWKWLDKIGLAFGKNIDVETIISNLEIPNAFLRGFSVGFYVLRLIVNGGMIVKHVWYPTEGEKQLERKKRFYNEVYKRHADLLNDFIWGPVNLFANYNRIFHIPDPTAGWIFVGFLFFDVCLIAWRRHLAKDEYLAQRLQLTKDRRFYQEQPLPDLTQDPTVLKKILENREMQLRLLTEQIDDLDRTWQAKDANFWFNGGAAVLLLSGFTFSLIFSTPVMVLACYAICVIGVAMYLSDGAYNQYKEKKLLLQQAVIEEENLHQARVDYVAARNEFIWTMVKNAIIPTVAIALYALCWQAALTLTLAYFCYQMYMAYTEHSKSKLDPVVEETVTENDEEELEAIACTC